MPRLPQFIHIDWLQLTSYPDPQAPMCAICKQQLSVLTREDGPLATSSEHSTPHDSAALSFHDPNSDEVAPDTAPQQDDDGPDPMPLQFQDNYFSQYDPADFNDYDEFAANGPDGNLGMGNPTGNLMEIDLADGNSKSGAVDGVEVDKGEDEDEEYEEEQEASNLEEEMG